MEALPLPGGDPLSHDYEIRAKSPPTRPERRDFSYRTRHLRRSHSAKLPEWRKKVEEHVSLGGAPYPRTVLLTNLPLRRSARECHRQEVLVRKVIHKLATQQVQYTSFLAGRVRCLPCLARPDSLTSGTRLSIRHPHMHTVVFFLKPLKCTTCDPGLALTCAITGRTLPG